MCLGYAHLKAGSPKAMVSLWKYVLLNGIDPLDEIQKLSLARREKRVEIRHKLKVNEW